MSIRKFKTSGADRDATLLEFVVRAMAMSPAEARRRITEGGVYVDRVRTADPNRRLVPGTQLAIHPAAGPAPKLEPIYLDEDVLIIDKPAGLPSQATRDSTALAADAIVLARHPEARLFHRLDREVTGLLMFTRGAQGHVTFRSRLQRGALIRRYRARVSGHLSCEAGVFAQPIGPDPRDRTRQRAGIGKPAETEYRVLHRGASNGQPFSEVELTLRTGRTHQIRVHLADAGHPVLGDARYGIGGPALFLAAYELEWPGQTVTSARGRALFAACETRKA